MTVIDEMLNEPLSAPLRAAIDGGAVPVGYTCGCVPEVMLFAAGLLPVRVRAPGKGGTENADAYLSSVTCSYVRSVLELAMDGSYGFLKGWVFASGCDHLRRLCDNILYLSKPAFCHLLDVPHASGAAALAWFEGELEKFRVALRAHFGCGLGDDALSEAIAVYNADAALFREIGDLRKPDSSPITGGEFHRLMLARTSLPQGGIRDLARDFLHEVKSRTAAPKARARLMVAGGQIDDPMFTDVIESQGALVAADRYCTGSIPGLAPIETGMDPIKALARNIFRRTGCPRIQGGFEERLAGLLNAVREYSIDGVILESVKFCDIWGVETGAMARALREAGVPALRLDREYRPGGEGQIQTRVQAFLESMGR